MISDKHRNKQKEIHSRRPEYGAAGHQWADMVNELAANLGTKDVLDYGAGKQYLSKSLPMINIKNYDPAFDEIAAAPEPADLVICTHVLPYVEKDQLNNVIDDLKRVTKKSLLTIISTTKSSKLLDEGESVTQIEMNAMEWLLELNGAFELISFNKMSNDEFAAVWVPR